MVHRLIWLAMVMLVATGAAGGIDDGEPTRLVIDLEDRSRLEELSRLVSIDDVRDGRVLAVASIRQLERLRAAGFIWQEVETETAPVPATMCPVGWEDDPGRTWDCYPSYGQYEGLMTNFAADYPDLCRLVDLGATTNQVSPHRLWAVRISDNPDLEEAEPEVLYASTMHGNETTGYVLMLRLINELLTGYGSDPELTSLVDDLEIWINPLHNPDGTYRGGNNTVDGAIRYYTDASGNPDGPDPNRNFPDPEDGQHPDGEPWWTETIAMMDFAEAHSIVLSANFHGGIEVVNYPWDTWARRHVDDDWLIHISRAYADAAQAASPPGYMTALNNGITNGYDWYTTSGNRQDFMTYFHGSREVTIEISDAQLLPASQLDDHWQWNRQALLDYIGQARYGIHGVITDYNEQPLAATVEIVGLDSVADNSFALTDPDVGDYHRLLLPGTYTIRVNASGYYTVEISDVILPAGFGVIMDVVMDPLPTATVTGEITTPNPPGPIAGATVEITDLGAATTTAGDGSFSLTGIYEGVRTFTVSADGYETIGVDRMVSAPTTELDFGLAPVTSHYETDLETDDGGLTTGQGWQWGQPSGTGNPGAHSGTRVWATNLSGAYSNGADWLLELSGVTIVGGGARLRFWHWYDIEQGSSDWDGGNVAIRPTSGGSYEVLDPDGGYPSGNVSALGEPGFTGLSGGWRETVFDLSAWADQAVDLRWRFASDGSVQHLGWYLDDISIVSADRRAEFEFDPTSPVPGGLVTFTDRSSGPVTDWWWEFGDGATSDDQHPTHTFSADGIYPVTLTVTYTDGQASITKPIPVGSAAAVFSDGFESGDLSEWSAAFP